MEALIGAVFVKNYDLKNAFNLLYVFDFYMTNDFSNEQYMQLIQEDSSLLIPIPLFNSLYKFLEENVNYI